MGWAFAKESLEVVRVVVARATSWSVGVAPAFGAFV